MGDFSYGFRDSINTMITGGTPATGYGLSDLTEVYYALVSTTPDANDVEIGDLTEVTSSNYQRVAVNASYGVASALGVITSDADITWPQDSAGDFGPLRGWVAVAGGTKGTTTDKIFYFHPFSAVTPSAGDTPTIEAGNVGLTMT